MQVFPKKENLLPIQRQTNTAKNEQPRFNVVTTLFLRREQPHVLKFKEQPLKLIAVIRICFITSIRKLAKISDTRMYLRSLNSHCKQCKYSHPIMPDRPRNMHSFYNSLCLNKSHLFLYLYQSTCINITIVNNSYRNLVT